jgi:CRP-like cAMP-binding protein
MSRVPIEDIPLFATLPDEARERLAAHASVRRFRAGEVVIEEGAVAAGLFAITSGTAGVEVDGETVAELGKGEFFGEMGTLKSEEVRWPRRSATVTATTKLDVIAIPDHDVHKLIDELPSFGELLRSAAETRARENAVD